MKLFSVASITERYDVLGREVEAELRKRARQILRKEKWLREFVKAMGIATFTDKQGSVEHGLDDPRFASVSDLIDEFDSMFHMTGDPVRFTATGPEVTDW